MKIYNINKFLDNPDLVDKEINKFKDKKIIINSSSNFEIKGHLQKAEHNLEFVNDLKNSKYLDWAITALYYSAYHAALSLILTRNYSSKNHFATLLILIKEFYKKELDKKDIDNFSEIIDYEDVLFYVKSKNSREDASYSTNKIFDKSEFNKLRIKTILFVSKIKEIIYMK